MTQKNIIILTAGVVIVILAGYFFWGQKVALAPSEEIKTTKTETKINSSQEATSAKIAISNQLPGEVVLVSEVIMIDAGWVAVHDNNNGQPGNILGAYFLPAGTYQNQMIPLLRGVTDGNSYLIVIHQDDGDKIFDYKLDTPVTDTAGQLETASFNVVAESSTGE